MATRWNQLLHREFLLQNVKCTGANVDTTKCATLPWFRVGGCCSVKNSNLWVEAAEKQDSNKVPITEKTNSFKPAASQMRFLRYASGRHRTFIHSLPHFSPGKDSVVCMDRLPK